MGYFVEADGTVRSEESVKKEINENIRKVNNAASFLEETEREKLKANVKRNIVTPKPIRAQQKRETRSYCPVCDKWISGSMSEHMKVHMQLKYFPCPYCRQPTAYATDRQKLSHVNEERKRSINLHLERHSKFISEFCGTNRERLNKCREHCEGLLLSWEKDSKGKTAAEFLELIATDKGLERSVLSKEKQESLEESQKKFLVEYFKDKPSGFKANGRNIEKLWQEENGLKNGFAKEALSYLESYLKKRGLFLRVKKALVIVCSIKAKKRGKNKRGHAEINNNTEFISRKKKNRKHSRSSKTYQNEKRQNPYTATIADITGRDTYYANKGDYRFRDSNGQFGSTPLYDDYDS